MKNVQAFIAKLFFVAVFLGLPMNSFAEEVCGEASDTKAFAKLIVYRAFKVTGAGAKLAVRADCGKAYLLGLGQYRTFNLPPGKHVLWSHFHRLPHFEEKGYAAISHRFFLQEGETLYLRIKPSLGEFSFDAMDSQKAMKKISGYEEAQEVSPNPLVKTKLIESY